jgi:DNA (cytosine-5)-methyltransferase 1
MERPRALDLFCCAGGVSVGLQRAGFDVTGVDIHPQPRYRGGVFVQEDALAYPLDGFDFIWASPPCQAFTKLRVLHPEHRAPDLIAAVRTRLEASGAAWVIENVPGAPLRAPILLCGSMFPELVALQRHRLFESSLRLLAPSCNHAIWKWGLPVAKSNLRRGRTKRRVVGVYGGGLGTGDYAMWTAAMGIDWMTRKQLSQAIPPAYAEYLGRQVIAQLHQPRDLGSQLIQAPRKA